MSDECDNPSVSRVVKEALIIAERRNDQGWSYRPVSEGAGEWADKKKRTTQHPTPQGIAWPRHPIIWAESKWTYWDRNILVEGAKLRTVMDCHKMTEKPFTATNTCIHCHSRENTNFFCFSLHEEELFYTSKISWKQLISGFSGATQNRWQDLYPVSLILNW